MWIISGFFIEFSEHTSKGIDKLRKIDRGYWASMQKEKNVFLHKKKANTGDVILFERNNNTFEGTVFHVRTNSVLVEISNKDAKILGYEQPNTVIGHGKYSICSEVPAFKPGKQLKEAVKWIDKLYTS